MEFWNYTVMTCVFAAAASEMSMNFDQLSQVVSRNVHTMTHNGSFSSLN